MYGRRPSPVHLVGDGGAGKDLESCVHRQRNSNCFPISKWKVRLVIQAGLSQLPESASFFVCQVKDKSYQ